jgi:hypothetical protein
MLTKYHATKAEGERLGKLARELAKEQGPLTWNGHESGHFQTKEPAPRLRREKVDDFLRWANTEEVDWLAFITIPADAAKRLYKQHGDALSDFFEFPATTAFRTRKVAKA